MTPEAAGLRFPLQFVGNAQQKDEIQSWDAKSDSRSMAAKGTRNRHATPHSKLDAIPRNCTAATTGRRRLAGPQPQTAYLPTLIRHAARHMKLAFRRGGSRWSVIPTNILARGIRRRPRRRLAAASGHVSIRRRGPWLPISFLLSERRCGCSIIYMSSYCRKDKEKKTAGWDI